MKQLAKTTPRRIVIYPADIALLTGRNIRTAQRFLNEIKAAYGKEKHEYLSVHELCGYMGWAVDDVWDLISA